MRKKLPKYPNEWKVLGKDKQELIKKLLPKDKGTKDEIIEILVAAGKVLGTDRQELIKNSLPKDKGSKDEIIKSLVAAEKIDSIIMKYLGLQSKPSHSRRTYSDTSI